MDSKSYNAIVSRLANLSATTARQEDLVVAQRARLEVMREFVEVKSELKAMREFVKRRETSPLSSIGLPIFVCLILVLAISRKLRALCLRVSLRACWRTCGWACSAICCVGGAVRSAVRCVCSCFGLYRRAPRGRERMAKPKEREREV